MNFKTYRNIPQMGRSICLLHSGGGKNSLRQINPEKPDIPQIEKQNQKLDIRRFTKI